MSELEEIRRQFGDPVTYVSHIKRQLALHGKSLSELARVMARQQEKEYRYARENIRRWFNGKRAPTLISLIGLNDAFDELIYGGD